MIKRVDSGGQVHLVTNIRKPRKWRRYEYLQSSGTQYIDTVVALSLTDKFEFETDFTYSPANSTAYPFYGTEDYRTGFMAQYHYQNNGLYPLWIEGTWCGDRNIAVDAESRMYSKTVIDVPNKTWAIIYNTTSVEGTYSDQITDTTSTVKFFGNDQYSSKYVTKCYYFKIKINDILVRDFVPAQYNGQYGMWDLVEDKFYPNKGTGSFTVGPEMKNYDEINEVRKTTSLLPAGVELYDYIQSSDTQYIDTGYKPNGDTRVVMKFQYTSYNSPSALFGARNGGSSGAFNLWCMSDLFGAQYNDNAYGDNKKNVNLGTSEPFTVDYNKNICTVKGVSATFTKASFTVNYNLLLLALQGGSGVDSRKSAGKLYYCQIYDNGTLIRNFIPCTYLGEPGMWDTVENKFYRNQGTGQFTLGNKITLKEYEYLQSSGTQYINTEIPYDSTKSTYKIECKFSQPSNVGSYDAIFGAYTDENSKTLRIIRGNNNSIMWSYYNTRAGGGICGRMGTANSNIREVVLTSTKTIVTENGTTITYTHPAVSGNDTTSKFYLFCQGTLNGSVSCLSKSIIYYFKLYDNDTLIKDLIPVSYNGTPGLWDKVEWKFYGNAGSGSFTLGPEKASGSIYLYDHLTNLFNGFIGGGQMTLSNGILVGTGNDSDTYFRTKTTQAVNTTSYYLVGLYVEGYTSATAWTFCSPQSNNNAALRITRDGWNWGYVKFGNADSQPIWDDTTRTFSGPVPKITISDCRIYKIT